MAAIDRNMVIHYQSLTPEQLDALLLPRGERLGDSVNHAGTAVSVHRCRSCGRVFTCCPAIPDTAERNAIWTGCLAERCDTYDIERDADLFFEPAFEAGIIHRERIDVKDD